MKLKLLFFAVILLTYGCVKHKVAEPFPNAKPETYISLFPDSTLNQSTSNLHIHWWGVDKDGWVVSYVFSFDRVNWFWTFKNDSIFKLQIFGADTSYNFWIFAVDNTVKIKFSEGQRVNFVDKDGDGLWSLGEKFEISPDDSYDDTPASLTFPIKNTPPTVEFAMTGEFAGTRLDVPDTTFPIVSFQWIASDIDGDNTISEFWVALNDTSSWVVVPGQFRFLTLLAENFSQSDTIADAFVIPSSTQTLGRAPVQGTLKMRLNGENVFYLKARDIAGAFSRTIRMPSEEKKWFVKRPKGNLLIVADYGVADNSINFYKSVFDTLVGGNYDVWDLRVGSRYPRRGILVPPFPRVDFSEVLTRFYNYVFWVASDEVNFDIAAISLPKFKSQGGKVLFSFILPQSTTPDFDVGKALSDLSGVVDSVSSTPLTGFVPAGTRILNYNPINPAEQSDYPILVRDSPADNPVDGGKILAFLRALYPSASAHPIYWLEPQSAWGNRSFTIGAESIDKNFVLVGFPIYRFNGGTKKAGEFIWKVFNNFGALGKFSSLKN
ncbi:hypothetical protein [Candidatus Kryptobacter tengchongensis]|uniref:hypothetical protein n=1 Tax=Kryptobacter tengchongensis TaxID=1643429 RepID=UPI00117CE8AC|nr:hypothetical protein [Candidatus Kryptobacter tengchongensis]